MKKPLSLLLAALLLLSTAGCGARQQTAEAQTTAAETQAPVTEAPEEVPAPSVPETLPQATYPQTITSAISVEGEPEELTLDLFDGGNYVIYIPQDTFTLETSLQNGMLTDRWSCSWAPEAFLEVVSWGHLTPEETEQRYRELYPQLQFLPDAQEAGAFSLQDPQFQRFRSLTIRSDGKNTFSIFTEMPPEFGDGFFPRFSAMENSFEIK